MGNANSGPRKLPVAIRMLKGKQPRQRALQAPAGEVQQPPTLSTRAVAVWRRLAPLCVAMQTLTPADTTAFATFCELQGAFEALKPTARNQEAQRRLATALRAYYALFGLEPASRSRMHMPAAPPPSKWDGLLSS